MSSSTKHTETSIEFLENVKNFHKGVVSFGKSWSSQDDAGGNLLAAMQDLFVGTEYEMLGGEFYQKFSQIYTSNGYNSYSAKMKEIENVVSGLLTQLELDTKEKSSSLQILFRCLLLFLKLKSEYHQQCSEMLMSMTGSLLDVCDKGKNKDVEQLMKSLEMLKYPSPCQSPTRGLGTKKSSQGNGSPKTQAKHGTPKKSLFSLFDRKNSPDETKSSFYVDICDNNSDAQSSQQNRKDDSVVTGVTMTTGAKEEQLLVDLGLDPGHVIQGAGARSGVGAEILVPTSLAYPSAADTKEKVTKGAPSGGQLATQEELNSVINLLSGVGIGHPSLQMQTIPEHQDSSFSLQVPSAIRGSLSPCPSDSIMDDLKSKRIHVQRRSEGSLDLSGMGSNTWPYQHRSSLPAGHLNPQSLYESGTVSLPRRYSNDLNLNQPRIPVNTHFTGAGTSPYAAGYQQWGAFPESKMNRTWPTSNLTNLSMLGSTSDTVNSSWSGAQDSDDLSDDSSAGDQFFNMGTDLMSKMEPKARIGNDGAPLKKSGRPNEDGSHRSFEDLLDSKSTNTWPLQNVPTQPWMGSSQNGEVIGAMYHRPVQMQWSDPVSATSNMWPTAGGLNSQQQQMPSHSSQGFGQM